MLQRRPTGKSKNLCDLLSCKTHFIVSLQYLRGTPEVIIINLSKSEGPVSCSIPAVFLCPTSSPLLTKIHSSNFSQAPKRYSSKLRSSDIRVVFCKYEAHRLRLINNPQPRRRAKAGEKGRECRVLRDVESLRVNKNYLKPL